MVKETIKKHKITLFQEEINALLEFGEISIFKNNDIEIVIDIDTTEENILRQDILDRYNNEEYFNREVLVE